MFEDRKDAGKKLAKALEKYKGKDVLVLAIPRGGVAVGCEIAKYLKAEFSIIVARKLPFPQDPEAGFGAVAEDGSIFMLPRYADILPKETIKRILKEQKAEALRRIRTLRNEKPLPQIKGRTVILVDDGIAMGSTMRASIELCRNKGAKKIVVASPVSSKESKEEIGSSVDEIIILETPPSFRAVAQAYRHWYDVTDEEVIDILKKYC